MIKKILMIQNLITIVLAIMVIIKASVKIMPIKNMVEVIFYWLKFF